MSSFAAGIASSSMARYRSAYMLPSAAKFARNFVGARATAEGSDRARRCGAVETSSHKQEPPSPIDWREGRH
jgi:hypothetical protein